MSCPCRYIILTMAVKAHYRQLWVRRIEQVYRPFWPHVFRRVVKVVLCLVGGVRWAGWWVPRVIQHPLWNSYQRYSAVTGDVQHLFWAVPSTSHVSLNHKWDPHKVSLSDSNNVQILLDLSRLNWTNNKSSCRCLRWQCHWICGVTFQKKSPDSKMRTEKTSCQLQQRDTTNQL